MNASMIYTDISYVDVLFIDIYVSPARTDAFLVSDRIQLRIHACMYISYKCIRIVYICIIRRYNIYRLLIAPHT